MDSHKESPNPKVWVKEVGFSDRTKISISPNDIVVLVGPNNSGKSIALKNIEQKAQDVNSPGIVVTSLKLGTEGDESCLLSWLERNSKKNLHNPSNPVYARMGASVPESQAKGYWADCTQGLHALAKFFFCLLTTEERLSAANPANNIDIVNQPLSHPIHYMQKDDTVEQKASEYFHEAFGEDLVVNRNAGNKVPLHCGKRPEAGEKEDRLSASYLERLGKLPTLHTQGDGMRSFIGVLLHSLVVDHSVVLIDEPEAFLHPPQARLLGQMIVKEAPKGRQFFLATHSGDLLRGLLDSQSSRVRIIRIQRNDDVNPVKELDNDGIKKVWGDPILRYSDVLDGLFHEKVILCESDSDCRFYAAIMDAVTEGEGDVNRGHVMFLHCGGKARMPVVVSSLRNLDVPVRVVADFDLLNSESPLKSIVEALGGVWSKVESNWQQVRKAIEEKKPELSTGEVKKEIENVLKSITQQNFPSDAKKNIQKILRRSSPWSTAKTVGKTYIPNGDPTKAFDSMCAHLKSLGLFIVQEGELEGFVRSVGGHGPKWVNSVLDEKDIVTDSELENAGVFIQSVVNK